MTELTAYFDGGCPLCRREIAHYRGIDRAGHIRFVDLNGAAAELAALGIDRDTAMRRLHVREAEGRLLTGVAAFVAIWRRLPFYRRLATLVTRLGLTGPLDWLYVRFADRRYRRRCRDGACAVD